MHNVRLNVIGEWTDRGIVCLSVIENVIVIENVCKTATGIEKENENAIGNAIALERGNVTEKGNATGKEKGIDQFLLHRPPRPQYNVLIGGNCSISFIFLLLLTCVVVQANGIGASQPKSFTYSISIS